VAAALLLGSVFAGGASAHEEDQAAASSPYLSKRAELPGDGFQLPNLSGPFRWRVALDGWLPTNLDVTVNGNSITLTDEFILSYRLKYIFPMDGEVRKGSLGFYVHTQLFRFKGTASKGPLTLNYEDSGSLTDVGLSYEVARWAFGEGVHAKTLTLEPTFAGRLLHQPVDVQLATLPFGTTIDASSYVPVIGLRLFSDLGEHWNLHFLGDYGGFGVGGNHQVWQGVGLLGYRWGGWGLGWNLQAGYRGQGLLDLKRNGNTLKEVAYGPNVVLSAEF
jgi:hypothetical protein